MDNKIMKTDEKKFFNKNTIKRGVTLKKFIVFDKDEKKFYNNLYLDKFKIVFKMPLIKEDDFLEKIKIEKFDLAKYTFLFSYD